VDRSGSSAMYTIYLADWWRERW